jgi:hypothetical protein
VHFLGSYYICIPLRTVQKTFVKLYFPAHISHAAMSCCVFFRAIESVVFHARAHICTRPPNIQAFEQHDSRDQYVMSLTAHATRPKWIYTEMNAYTVTLDSDLL